MMTVPALRLVTGLGLVALAVSCAAPVPGGVTSSPGPVTMPLDDDVQEAPPQHAPERVELLVLPPTVVDNDPAPPKQSTTSLAEFNRGLETLSKTLLELRDRLAQLEARVKSEKGGADPRRRIDGLNAELERLRAWTRDYQARLNQMKPGEDLPAPPRPLLPDRKPSAYGDEGKEDAKDDQNLRALMALAGTALCIYQPELCPFIVAMLAAIGLDLPGGVEQRYETMAATERALAGQPVSGDQLNRLHQIVKVNDFKPELTELVLEGLQVQMKNKNSASVRLSGEIADEVHRRYGKLGPPGSNLVEKIGTKQFEPLQAALDTLDFQGDGNQKRPVFRNQIQKLLVQVELQKLFRNDPAAFDKYWTRFLRHVPVQGSPARPH